MFSKKTAFTRPLVQHSQIRTDKQYPEPKAVETKKKTEMSVQKPAKSNFVVPKTIKNIGAIHVDPYALGPGVRYHALVSQQLTQDPTVAWALALGPTTSLHRTIKMGYMEIVYTGRTSQFPNVIYLTIDGVTGYRDATDSLTNRVAAFVIQQIQSSTDGMGERLYDVRYVVKSNQVWSVDTSLPTLIFRLFEDQNPSPLQLPLANAFFLNLQIKDSIQQQP